MERTFEIAIHSCENHTWQGVLRWAGGEYPFHSDLELLLEMARQLCPERVTLPPPTPEKP